MLSKLSSFNTTLQQALMGLSSAKRVYILAASTWIKTQPEAFTALIIAEAMWRQMVGSLQHNFVQSLHANTKKVSQPDLRDIIADVLIVSQITIGVGSLILADAL